jgi:hypothetical protein
MTLKWESFPDESFKYNWSSKYGTKTYWILKTFMYLGHSLPELVFYYSLLLNFCDFNAAELFFLEPKRRGGGAAWASFMVNSLRCTQWKKKIHDYIYTQLLPNPLPPMEGGGGLQFYQGVSIPVHGWDPVWGFLQQHVPQVHRRHQDPAWTTVFTIVTWLAKDYNSKTCHRLTYTPEYCMETIFTIVMWHAQDYSSNTCYKITSVDTRILHWNCLYNSPVTCTVLFQQHVPQVHRRHQDPARRTAFTIVTWLAQDYNSGAACNGTGGAVCPPALVAQCVKGLLPR